MAQPENSNIAKDSTAGYNACTVQMQQEEQGQRNEAFVASQSNLEAGSAKAASEYGPPHPDLFEHFPPEPESLGRTVLTIFVPFMLAGCGIVFSGIFLDSIQHLPVFQQVDELFVMIPALLGLKGNLGMTSASRWSTAANTGMITDRRSWLIMAGGSISITQAQSIVVGLLSGIAAVPLSFLQEWSVAGFHWTKFSVLVCSGAITSTIASLLLDSLMIIVVTLCHLCHINPDNVALPVAASLGDICTLLILGSVSQGLWDIVDTYFWVIPSILGFLLLLLPLWLISARRNQFVRQVTADGWIPVISAMLISSIGGLVMKGAVSSFEYIAMYQTMLSGVGGNLAAIQASRISTRLHQLFEQPGSLFWRQMAGDENDADKPIEDDEVDENSEANQEEIAETNENVDSDGSCQSDESRTPSQDDGHEDHEDDKDEASVAASEQTSKIVEVAGAQNNTVVLEMQQEQAAKSSRSGKPKMRCDSTAVRTIATYLHPLDKGIILKRKCPNPAVTFCSRSSVARSAQILITLLIPGELAFLFIIYAVHGKLQYTAEFVLIFLAAALLHLLVLLYLTHWIIQMFWRIGRDPDNFGVPYITAIGDVLGSLLVTASFYLLRSLNNPLAIGRVSKEIASTLPPPFSLPTELELLDHTLSSI